MADDENTVERTDGDVLVLTFSLLTIGIGIGFLYEVYPIFSSIERYFPFASANMVLGFAVGLILSLTGTLVESMNFTSEFFFIYLLPPIIFHAGYSLPKDFFFHNFGSIMTFAFVGTTLSAFFIGATLTAFGELGICEKLSFTKNMMMGSLISAVDPVAVILVLKSLNVDEQLKVLLFGESVLNDAAAVVINRVFVDIEENGKTTSEALAPAIPQIIGIAVASMLIGTIVALFVAAIHKYTQMGIKNVYDIELAAFLIGAFIPYGIAEALSLSGICSVLFAGIMTDYYTKSHLSKKSQITTKQTIASLAFVSELFVFIYLGMSFFLEEGHEFRGGYITLTLILCFIGRAISVFPLAFLLNIGRKHKLPFKHQIILWYSGLRGPVAYALAKATPSDSNNPDADNIIITSTIFIVAFTTLVLGGLAYPFLKWVKPSIMRSTSQTKTDTYDISNHWFNRLDRRFLRPYFGPKTRRKDINNPLVSEISTIDDDQLEQIEITETTQTNQNIKHNKHKNRQDRENGYDMNLINDSKNDDLVEDEEEEKNNNLTEHKNEIKNNTRLKIISDSKDSKSIIDYSMPRTKPPSFIDNPQEQSQSHTRTATWSEMNSQQNVNLASTSNLNALSDIAKKSVTPPPT